MKFNIERRSTISTSTGSFGVEGVIQKVAVTASLIANKTITLTNTPVLNTLHVQFNGQDLVEGDDYTLLGTTITLDSSFEMYEAEDVFQIQYLKKIF